MASRQYSSTATAKTLAEITSETLTLNSPGISTLPTVYPYTLVIDPDTASEEIVTVRGLVGGAVLSITRGQDGTSSTSHNSGAVVKHMITPRDMQEPQNHIEAASAYTIKNDGVDTGVTGPTIAKAVHGIASGEGSVVGTAKTQTLTNKTLTSPTITDPTISGTITGAVVTSANLVDGTIVNADINASAAIADTKLATIATSGKVSNSATTATNANTGSAIVARDSSGNFSAGTITASLTGNVTGNVSGSSGSCTGNAATSSSTTGNAATATALQTARTINGVSFNGTANIKTHTGGTGVADGTGFFDRVYHGLGVAPSSYSVTMRSNSVTGSPRIFYITNVNETFFDVYSLNTSGTAAAGSFYWTAVV